VVRIRGTIQDITERKQSEVALLESEERFRGLSDASFEGVAFSDAGKVVLANTRLAEMLGGTISVESQEGKGSSFRVVVATGLMDDLRMISAEEGLAFLKAPEEPLMAKAYMVVTYRSISNADALAAYAKIAGPAVQAAGGKFLVRGMPAKTYEAGMNERTVVVEFPSLAAARAAYEGPGYAEALKALGKNAAVRDMRIVEGVE